MCATKREVDWARAVEGVGNVHVGAAIDEQPDDLELAFVGSEAKRGDAVA